MEVSPVQPLKIEVSCMWLMMSNDFNILALDPSQSCGPNRNCCLVVFPVLQMDKKTNMAMVY